MQAGWAWRPATQRGSVTPKAKRNPIPFRACRGHGHHSWGGPRAHVRYDLPLASIEVGLNMRSSCAWRKRFVERTFFRDGAEAASGLEAARDG